MHISAIRAIPHGSAISTEEIFAIYFESDPTAAASDLEPDFFGTALAISDEMKDLLVSDEEGGKEWPCGGSFA